MSVKSIFEWAKAKEERDEWSLNIAMDRQVKFASSYALGERPRNSVFIAGRVI